MVEEKPVAAFTISLIGLALYAIGTIASIYAMYSGFGGGLLGPGTMMGPGMMMGGAWSTGFLWSPLSSILTVFAVALGSLGVLWMNVEKLNRVRTGSTLVLVSSIITFSTMSGFMLGSLLMFIGGIIGLTWQPLDLR